MADFAYELDTLDELSDDAHKALYRETDGKFRLDLNAYGEFVKAPVLAKNKELLGGQKKHKEAAEALAKKFEGLEDDELDAFRQWKEAQANSGNAGEGGKPGDIAALQQKWQADRAVAEKKLKEAHAKQIGDYEAKIKQIEAEKNAFILETKANELFAANKGDLTNPAARKTLQLLFPQHFAFDEKGRIVAVDSDGDPLDVVAEEYFANTFRSQYGFLFLSDEQGGTGTPNLSKGSKTDSKTLTRVKFDKLSPSEKMKFIKGGGAVTD